MQEGVENLNYRLHIHLLYGFSVGSSLKRDLSLPYTLERSNWLQYESQCWTIRFVVGRLDEVDSVMVTFSLKGLGEF